MVGLPWSPLGRPRDLGNGKSDPQAAFRGTTNRRSSWIARFFRLLGKIASTPQSRDKMSPLSQNGGRRLRYGGVWWLLSRPGPYRAIPLSVAWHGQMGLCHRAPCQCRGTSHSFSKEDNRISIILTLESTLGGWQGWQTSTSSSPTTRESRAIVAV